MQNETTERVKACLAEVLALDPKNITEDASIIGDLGADSLDLVELMFMLERRFGVRLTQDDMRLTRQLDLSEEELHVNEVLTPLALERLRARFPESHAVLVEGVTRKQLAVLLTVRHVVASIETKLAQGAAQSRSDVPQMERRS